MSIAEPTIIPAESEPGEKVGVVAEATNDPPAAGGDGQMKAAIGNLFEVYKAEGNGFVKTEKYEDALQKYGLAWAECATDDQRAMILNNKGVVAEKIGTTDQAMEFFNHALSLKPEYVKVLIRRGMVYKKLKDFDNAFNDIAEAYVLAIKQQQTVAGMQDVIADVILDCAEAEINSMPDERKFMFPKDHFVRGYFRQFYGDPFSRMWKGLDPTPSVDGNGNPPLDYNYLPNLQLWIPRCTGVHEKRKVLEIPGHCNTEIDNEGTYRQEAFLLRGSFSFLSGRREPAEADFMAVIDDPNASNQLKSTAHVKMAILMNLWSTSEDTASHFAEAEVLWKENCDVYYQAALCLIDKGEGIPALALLEKGAQLCPDPRQAPLLHILCSSIKMTHNAYCDNPSDTLGKLRAMEADGYFDSPECYEYFAQTLLLFDNMDASLAQFDKAAKISNGERIFELKKVMANQITNQDPEQTIKCLEEYTDDPEVGNTAWYHIGEMNFILGRQEAGFEAFDNAIASSHSVYDVKAKVMGKIDFKYNCILTEKMKQHGLDFLSDKDDLKANALE